MKASERFVLHQRSMLACDGQTRGRRAANQDDAVAQCELSRATVP